MTLTPFLLFFVFGGANCEHERFSEIMRDCKEIDFTIVGEGEISLLKLYFTLIHEEQNFSNISGLLWRQNGNVVRNRIFEKLVNLEALPYPDYDDYFSALDECEQKCNGFSFSKVVTIETSRGCFWGKCVFCSYTGRERNNDCAYRRKSIARVVDEIDFLTKKWKVFSVYFADLVSSSKFIKELFAAPLLHERDFVFPLIQMRTCVTKEALKVFQNKFVGVVFGIETLSTSLLKKMNKGILAIQNIQAMKWAEELNIRSAGTIIVDFPLETERDVDLVVKRIKLIQCYRPLQVTCCDVHYGSPLFQSLKKYKIEKIIPKRNDHFNFLRGVSEKYSFEFDYINTFKSQRERSRLINKVKRAIEQWNVSYNEKKTSLIYRKGNGFLAISDFRYDENTIEWIVDGLECDLYLFCDAYKSLDIIYEEFSDVPQRKVHRALIFFVRNKLMFSETVEGRKLYLSLACHVN